MRNVLAWLIRINRQVIRSRRERATREVLARLDARALKDIGLESWNGELAERLTTYRQRQMIRLASMRIGAY